jgi:hypothetical protein
MPRNHPPREQPLAVVLPIDREDQNPDDLRYPNEDTKRKKRMRMTLVSMIHLKRKRKTLVMNTMRK